MAFSAAAAACTAAAVHLTTVLLNIVTAAPHRHQVERNVGHLLLLLATVPTNSSIRWKHLLQLK